MLGDLKLQEVVDLNQFQLHNRKPSSGVMKIGPKRGDYIAKRCDTLGYQPCQQGSITR